MPKLKNKKIKKKKIKRKITAKKSRPVLAKKKKETEENTDIIFDSSEGNLDNLFSAGVDLENKTVVTFADYKTENFEKLKAELKSYGAKFCSEITPIEVPRKPKEKKGALRKVFSFAKKFI